MAGKLKMVFQCIAVATSLLVLSYGDALAPAWMRFALHASVWIAIISTVYSGMGYLLTAGKQLR